MPLVLVVIGIMLLCARSARALDSQQVFESNESAVFQIRVINRETDKKSSIGSGFIYASRRDMVTNYHVVSQYIERPDDYELRYLAADGREGVLELVAVDAVHDLARVRADVDLGTPLPVGEPPPRGAPLFAMGNPLDLGLTIAAGTNGGVLSQTDGSRILFAGSLNPGMSGGPTFDEDGVVVGVNVSTARNDISFIVPTRYLGRLNGSAAQDPSSLLEQIATQIRGYQVDYIGDIIDAEWPMTTIRQVQVPGAVSPTVRCWDASPKGKPENLYRQYAINCKNENDIYLTDRLEVGKVLYEYAWLETAEMEPQRFYRLYEAFNDSQFGSRAGKDDVTRFRCETGFVHVSTEVMKTTVCRRDYKRYPGLSDVLFTSALVGRERTGFIFNIDLSGTDAATAARLIARFLGEIEWRP
ncbi:MAG: serine protease [Gammaproteobacteria bacterium]|nr:serine protease [Gammaproteobacteria bacterium]